MNPEFEKVLEETLNSATLTEIEKYGFCQFSESYLNEIGEKIKIEIYELDSKTYLIKYVNEKCVQFREITALNNCAVKEEKPKSRLKKATENFCAVRDHFLNEDRGTSRAFRLAWEKPMKFYHEHTPAEAVEILKREAEENVQ